MAEIKGLKKVLQAIQRRGKEIYGNPATPPKVIVGYTANYAIYVHENLQARHAGATLVSYKSGQKRTYIGVGQAKFLEQPARQYQDELAKIVRTIVVGGGTLAQGLYMAGLRLQRESMRLCPVDTGALRASAFTADVTGET